MPPGSDPIPSLILDNLETVLAVPDGGSDYFHDVLHVAVPGFRDLAVPVTPAVIILPEGTTDDDIELLHQQTTRWNMTIAGVLTTRSDDVPRDLIRFVHDIYKAIMTDPTRGGYAIDTKWTGWTPNLPADSADGTAWVECGIQVHYRTDDTDMTTAR